MTDKVTLYDFDVSTVRVGDTLEVRWHGDRWFGEVLDTGLLEDGRSYIDMQPLADSTRERIPDQEGSDV